MRLFLHRCLTRIRRRWHLQSARREQRSQGVSVNLSSSPAMRWRIGFILVAVMLAVSGPLVLSWHVQYLKSQLPPADGDTRLPSWQKILPGMRFEVPAESSVSWTAHPDGGLWIMAGMKEEAPVNIDLCRQQANARHWIPITIGVPFADIVQRVRRNQQNQQYDAAGLKSVVLSEEAGPQLEALAMLDGSKNGSNNEKQLTWRLRIAAGKFPVGALSDMNPGQLQQAGGPQASVLTMKKEAWLQWAGADGQRALHLQQRPSHGCEYGQLQLRWYRSSKLPGRAWVQPFTWQQGALPGLSLAAGAYQIPSFTAPPLEDQQLFEALLQNDLLRLTYADPKAAGLIELVPRTRNTEPATPPDGKAWPVIRNNPQHQRLWQRLYTSADGTYVRRQIQVFNREQVSGIRSGDQAYRHIKLIKPGTVGNREPLLAWQSVRRGPPSLPSIPSEVSVRDRYGRVLWDQGQLSAEAKEAGLAGLLVDTAETAHSLPSMLGRAGLGRTVNADLTLDLSLQTLAQKIVQCVGMQQGRWDGQTCVLPGAAQATAAATPSAAVASRRAAFILQDAETGEILASAQAGPSQRPLLAWQHDGTSHASPGSTFKVVTALGLEMAARQQPGLQALLAGMPLPELNRIAAQQGYAFRSDSACYPMPCGGRQPHLSNYREHILVNKTQAGQFGLVQALSASMNTWFAWGSEWTDASLLGQASGGVPDLQGLQSSALTPLRPILAAAQQLGFERVMRLDGGLLPAQFSWQSGDVLQSTAAHIDASLSRHELRQTALGLRMQSHVLQMAQVAAAIAEGEIRPPRLLNQLNQLNQAQAGSLTPIAPMPAKSGSPTAIVARLDRIRAGMHSVVQHGTAAQAFSGPEFKALRPYLYGKTGTAPTDETNNSAWFIGWVEAGQLPGQKHRLAFAAYVSHTELTGGAHAAPMVAGLLRSLLPPGLSSGFATAVR